MNYGGGGNPWADAANSYGHDLDQLGQIQQQGMQQQANAPLQLSQMFMQSYMAAKKQKQQEEAIARQERMDAEARQQQLFANERMLHNDQVLAEQRKIAAGDRNLELQLKGTDRIGMYDARNPVAIEPLIAIWKAAGKTPEEIEVLKNQLPKVQQRRDPNFVGPVDPANPSELGTQDEDPLSGLGPNLRHQRQQETQAHESMVSQEQRARDLAASNQDRDAARADQQMRLLTAAIAAGKYDHPDRAPGKDPNKLTLKDWSVLKQKYVDSKTNTPMLKMNPTTRSAKMLEAAAEFERDNPRPGGGSKPQESDEGPDMTTLGKNPRFKQAAWANKGPAGPGWYQKTNGQILKVE